MLIRRSQVEPDVDAPDHQHVAVELHLALRLRDQSVTSCRDVTRLQRASEGPDTFIVFRLEPTGSLLREPERGADASFEDGIGLGAVRGRAGDLQRPGEETEEGRRVRATHILALP